MGCRHGDNCESWYCNNRHINGMERTGLKRGESIVIKPDVKVPLNYVKAQAPRIYTDYRTGKSGGAGAIGLYSSTGDWCRIELNHIDALSGGGIGKEHNQRVKDGEILALFLGYKWY